MLPHDTLYSGKQFSTTLKLGEEYFSTVAYLDFKEKSSSMPWVRAALLAANLSAPRSIDGIAKCLTKADCEKLKSKHQKALVIQCESMLAMNWATLQGKPWKDTPRAYNLMGTCMVRMALHIAKKETKGRDTKNYESLAELSALFSEELLEVEAAPGAPSVEPASSSHQQPMPQPDTLQAWESVCMCPQHMFVCGLDF